MNLPDGPRQILAALVAAAGFLGLYFGLSLVWWLALGLAVAVYAALLLLIPRRRPETEIMLTERVSAADIRAATQRLEDAAGRLMKAAGIAPEADRAAIADMAAHVGSIRLQIEHDPQDYRAARRLVTSYLPNMVASVENYVGLASRAQGSNQDRLSALSAGIRNYGPALERIDQACLENDFNALEAEVEALGIQMKRG